MEKPHTGLDECPRILLSCFRARNSGLLLLLLLMLLATEEVTGSVGDGGLTGSSLLILGRKAERRRSAVLCCCRCAAAAAATATLCSSRSLCPNEGFRMLSMEKGRADRSGFLFGAAPAAGRKGWNSSGGGPTPREAGGGGGVGSGEWSAECVDGDWGQ